MDKVDIFQNVKKKVKRKEKRQEISKKEQRT